ncbi:MAG: nucleoside monophosphate kinase [Candidatus Azambacteria bacterium]|nr:nucleoside monophosphate kinase [Candidatus Azambacteria bacterium]
MVTCYRSGPIERDPAAAFHGKNQIDDVLRELDIEIIGDTFEILKSRGQPQDVYGPKMKKLRDQGRFYDYSKAELLLVQSLKGARTADFVISRPAPEASGGTTSETVMTCMRRVPKLVIIGPHGEGILDNNSTFMIKMLTDYYSLVFNSEKDVILFIRKHIQAFRKGRDGIRQLFIHIKTANPYFNDRPKLLWDDRFEGKTIIIQGRPGAGKDTQGRMLQDLCGFKFFGSGFELRRLSSKFPVMGESLGKGNLAPEIIINYLMTSSLIKMEKFEPIVFTGTPKKIGEAKGLIEILDLLKRKPKIIIIDINDKLAHERILLRRNCNSCDMSFCSKKLTERPTCPNCGDRLTARAENMNNEAISKIFKWYKTDVESVVRFFEERGLVSHIDGHRDKEEIFENILEILKS